MRTDRLAHSTLFGLLFTSPAFSESRFNMMEGVTPLSHDIYDLHMIIFWICVAIGIVVFGAMIYAILYHRQSLKRTPGETHAHLGIELTWTFIPLLILIIMAVPATQVLIEMNNTEQEDLTIKVTGYQWKWRYEYLNQGISFFSNNITPPAELKNQKTKNPNYLRQVDHPLVVPIHKKIRFLMTSNDVVHGWWVPALGVKRDAFPGFINETWTRIERPGIYYGQCTELCGVNHAYMTIVVDARAENDFANWLAEQKGQKPPYPSAIPMIQPTTTQTAAPANTLAATLQQGEQIYASTCSMCHQADGKGLPPTFPSLRGSAIVNGPVGDHLNRVLNGKAGTAMQAFKDQLDDAALAAVITYERNTFGTDHTWVKPEDIKIARGKIQ